jgi:hypothetical protein
VALRLPASAADAEGMSDTFAFRAIPVPLYRRVNVRALKTALAGCVLVVAVASFARWTIRSERESFAAAARHEAATEVRPAVGSGAGPSLVSTAGVTSISAIDRAAQDAVRHTIARAERLFKVTGTLVEAGPGRLAQGSKRTTFTDGPSIGPSIVSVVATNTAWGAAVMSESGSCFAVRLDAEAAPRFGTLSSSCTGAAALLVTGTSW